MAAPFTRTARDKPPQPETRDPRPETRDDTITVVNPELSRREALKRLSVGVGTFALWPCLSEQGAAAFARIQRDGQPPKLAFLTAEQYATVDAIAETIIPADDHSPGAKAARVADYIDLLLSESSSDVQKSWVAGLAELDRVSKQRAGRPFSEINPDQALAVLTDVSGHEQNPTDALEQFFRDTKDATIRGYYTSEIGIQNELQYQGNRFLTEFVGCTHPEHGYVPPQD
jgi:Gluconate 2-dehydrogenase subunit 3